MAITIRNRETEELIRKIGRRTGEGPSAVIRRLAEREAGNQNEPTRVPDDEVKRRLAFFEELRQKYPPPDDGLTWKDMKDEMDAIFGDDLK